MNILVPMAGPEDAFTEASPFGKCLMEIDQKPLIEHVVQNLAAIPPARFIFVIRKEDVRRFHLDDVLRLLRPEATIIVADAPTAGAACTALLASASIDNDEPLIIANGDQILAADLGAIVQGFTTRSLDGGLIVFDAVHPRWSYVRVNADGMVVEAAEKRPISRHASAGFYYFRRGRDFVSATKEMIRKNDAVNGAFFVCPVYNQLILQNAQIGIFEIPSESYHSLGTPRGVDAYQERLTSRNARVT